MIIRNNSSNLVGTTGVYYSIRLAVIGMSMFRSVMVSISSIWCCWVVVRCLTRFSLQRVVCWASGADMTVAFLLVAVSDAFWCMTAIEVENGVVGLTLLADGLVRCPRKHGIRHIS